MSAETVYVRLAPFAPRQGYVVRRYSYKGTMFEGGELPKWYKVPAHIAKELAAEKQPPHDARAPNLFEIKTEDEKGSIQAEEHRRFLASMGVLTPSDSRVGNVRAPDELDFTDRFGGPVTADETVASGRDAALPPTRGSAVADDDDDASEDANVASDDGAEPKGTRNARPSWRRR